MSIRNGKDLEIDPLATLFPPMLEEEFARLKADISTLASWSRSRPIATVEVAGNATGVGSSAS
jgi:hypothetical protein